MYIIRDERGIRYISTEEPMMLQDGNIEAEGKVFTRITIIEGDTGQVDDHGPLSITAEEAWTPEEGAEVEALQQAGAPRELFLHITLSGGDGKVPPGVRLDGGGPAIHVSAALRLSADPISPVVPVSEEFRTKIRRRDGLEYDIVLVSLVNGLSEFDYRPMAGAFPAECQILEEDLGTAAAGGVEYIIRLAQSVLFKVFRVLA